MLLCFGGRRFGRATWLSRNKSTIMIIVGIDSQGTTNRKMLFAVLLRVFACLLDQVLQR